jgi:hypothetical protein
MTLHAAGTPSDGGQPGPVPPSPVPSPRCAMEVSLTEGAPPQLVHVPFIEVRHPQFVRGYQVGTQTFREAAWDGAQGRIRPDACLSDEALISELLEILRACQPFLPLEDQLDWLAWAAGLLAGWISARIPSPFPLYGNCLHCHQPADACGGCPRCGTCTCAAEPGARGTAEAS